MTIVEILLFSLILMNTLICGFIAFKLTTVKSAFSQLQILYFTDIRSKDGFIKKETAVQIKGQLLLGGIPIGHPFLISEQVNQEIDKEKINKILEEFAKPLVSLGLKVITKRLL